MSDALTLALKRAERENAPAPHPLDGVIRRLWAHKCNTFEIARYLQLEESFVAGRLAQMRDGEQRQ